MLRTCCTGLVVLSAAALVGCSDGSHSMDSRTGYQGGEGVYFDQNGERTYDSGGTHRMADGTMMNDRDMNGMRRNADGSMMNDRNMNGTHRMADGTTMNDRNMNGMQRNSDGTWTNDRNDGSNSRNWKEGRGDRGYNDRASYDNRSSDVQNMMMVNESELPVGARTCMTREAGGSTMTEVGRGTWDGKPAYCCKAMKDGHTYKITTDAEGCLISKCRAD